ncbi:MAG: hypothetical protein IJL17_09420, partial [Kiritimatiellae bacterium]|nr:hypothetical protein [Kiritimatiellia bacterium]
MEINGVLTKMMFDHERRRRAFYVEESYVIPWMYDYLTPHGLIMKINAEANSLDNAIIRNDLEFWDWYTRRLLRDPAFRRDIPAQKSFSKLRAAIAGLYADARNKARDNGKYVKYNDLAAQAFREAVALYPASPEATFRYIQSILSATGKWNAILDLIGYTDRVDPNNARTKDLRKQAQAARDALAALEGKSADKSPDAQADAYLDYGEANLMFNPQASYRCAETLQRIPSVTNSFDRLWRLATIYRTLGLDKMAAPSIAAAQKFPEANTYEKQHAAALVFDSAGEKEACVKAVQSAMSFPESQDFEKLLQYANLLLKHGKKYEAAHAVDLALPLATNAPTARILAAGEMLLRIDAPTYVPFVAKHILDPLLERTDTTWQEVQQLAEYYWLFRNGARSMAEAADYQNKALDCYSRFAQAVKNEHVYERLANMYAHAVPALPDEKRQGALRSAAEAYLTQASQTVLSKEPDLDGACQLAEKAYKTAPAYIKNTYLSDSGQEKNGPVDAESVKRLLVRKVANHQ